MDQAAEDSNATEVEYENGKVISVKIDLSDNLDRAEITMTNYWDKFDSLCQSALDHDNQDLYNSLKAAQQYVNGLTDGWYEFLLAFEKTIHEHELSIEDKDLAQGLVTTLKKSLER